MLNEQLFRITKIFINNTITLELENITDFNYIIKIDETIYNFNIGDTKIIKLYNENPQVSLLMQSILISVISEKGIYNVYLDINNNIPCVGFGEETLVETTKGPTMMKDLTIDSILFNSLGEKIKIKKIYVFHTLYQSKLDTKLIKIDCSKCGILLPNNPIILTLNNNLQIKEIILKGRTLYLNGKAKEYNKPQSIYGIETEDRCNYLLSGFIVESLDAKAFIISTH